MRKVYLIVLVLITVLLAGCLPQVQVTPTPTTKPSPTPTVIVTVPLQSSIYVDSGCTVVTQKPTPGPTPESIIASVSDKDWVKGPASAKVTIIEYGDFQ